MASRAQPLPRMPEPADFVCAILTAPATALLAVLGTILATLTGGYEPIDESIHLGAAAFVLIPPASILLRARSRRLSLGWACLLLCMTIVSMLATLMVLVVAMSYAYAALMQGF